ILKYASAIKDNGMPPGVFMIDDTWQDDYGVWEFNPAKFQRPKQMIDQLHKMGFKVMLWLCPFVSPDSPDFRELRMQNMFIRNRADLKPAMVEWWNGFSAVIDFTNPDAQIWFQAKLEGLKNEYGVDGFKLDGGDTYFYVGDYVSFKKETIPNDHTEEWARLGLEYPLNEYRACWKLGGQALAQRLHDKRHDWDDLGQLIPNIIAQGLIGYAFVCPDMIGGGEFRSFLDLEKIDQELVVRSAQCHALMPMMQFSVAPWRILSPENFQICKDMADLHVLFGEKILHLAKQSAKTGEPIIRNLEYMFSHQGYANIDDQFLLGEKIMVAPVLKKGARSRMVVIPEGKWKSDRGEVLNGPQTVTMDVPLERLPWFERVE
ncbi:glycoside hydrolase, partial [candidate division KSB1 bacterium]|nr:glycoside hydrolase [candidate division KSB1 bacterium]